MCLITSFYYFNQIFFVSDFVIKNFSENRVIDDFINSDSRFFSENKDRRKGGMGNRRTGKQENREMILGYYYITSIIFFVKGFIIRSF